MKPVQLLAVSAAIAALAVAEADAQQRAVGGPRITLPSHSNHFSWERGHGFKRGFFPIFVVERQVPVIALRQAQDDRVQKEREMVVTVPPPAPPQGEGSKRKPYVIGSTYASLPAGCMKMVELAASYYFCGGGEWYRQVGEGPSARYKAVARKL